jgi:hypothetical protein
LTLVFSALHVKIRFARLGGRVDAIPIRKPFTEELSVHRALYLLPTCLKSQMNWLNILLYIPHCRYGVSRSLALWPAKVMAKSLPSRGLLYNALFYLSHCDVSLFLKAKSPNSSYAAFLSLFSSFLKLTHRIGTAQVALVTSLPCLVTLFGSP